MIENLDGEIWKEIADVPGYYVSNIGRIRSETQVIKQVPNRKTGLYQAMTYCDGKPKLLNVSRQVGLAFLGKQPFETAVVRHISSDIQDNRVENLTWGKNGGNIQKQRAKNKYVIRQKTLQGLVIATYLDWELLEKRGYKRSSVMAASKGAYMEGRNVYKHYLWEVIKIKRDNDEI